MIIVDTSAWVEFLRGTGSPVCEEVDRLLQDEIAITDAITMEVLAGARDEVHLSNLRRLLARAVVLPTRAEHYDAAAGLYRTCRRGGQTVHKLIDCLVAAVAIGSAAEILHLDSDFTALSQLTPLRIHSVR